MPEDSRTRMIKSAATLIGARGISATSFSDVLADSGAPRGSIYHHFPNGKHQLVEEAIRWTGERILAYQRTYSGDTARGVIEHFVALWRETIAASNGGQGCVIAGVAVDTDIAAQPLTELARDSFRSWIALLAGQLAARGINPERASAIALSTLAGMEGAAVLCRAEGSVAPLDTIAAELLRLLPPEAG